MSIDDLLKEAKRLSVDFAIRDGELVIANSQGSSLSLRQGIEEHKDELIRLVKKSLRYGLTFQQLELIKGFGWEDGWIFSDEGKETHGLEDYSPYEIHQLMCFAHTSHRFPPRWDCHRCGQRQWVRRPPDANSFAWACLTCEGMG